MSKESDFLLGAAFGLLSQVRAYLIQKNDVDGVELIENDFQLIQQGVNNMYDCLVKEKKNES